MQNKIKYIVYDEKYPTHLVIVDMVEYMDKSDTREIIRAGSWCDDLQIFFDKYTEAHQYEMPAKIEQEQIAKARLNAGKDLGDVKRVEYPLIANNVLTPEEKKELLSKAFEDAAYLLHAAMVYTNTNQTIDCNVKMKTGEEYQMIFKRKIHY